jgi:hypothetical protein
VAFSISQSEPEFEPITLDLAKEQLRVDYPDEDDLIESMITAAREAVEDYTRLAFVERAVVAIFDRFPPFDPIGWDFWLTPGYPSPAAVYPNPLTRAVRLPIWPVISVDAVKYFDSGGTQQTLAEGVNYLTQLTHMPSLIYPYPGKIWPVTQYARMGCVEVDFTAGYTTIPSRAIQAMLMTLSYWWRNRGDGDDPTGSDMTARGLPAGALRILNSLARFAYA